jgi:RNA polymerase sigma factor (TIGR02999 family)
MNGPGDITILLDDWAAGKPGALDQLCPLVYDTLHEIARGQARPDRISVTATAVVHELYLRLIRYRQPNWQNRSHFFAFCARLMRQIVTDRARAAARDRRWMDPGLPTEELGWIGQQEGDYVDLDSAIDRLGGLSPELARVVELRFYLGCTAAETADVTGVSKATVDRQWATARAWLFRELRGSGGIGAASE